MKLLFYYLYLLLAFVNSLYLNKVNTLMANTISYKYMKSQTYLNTNKIAKKINELGFQDIMKSVIFTSDTRFNKMCNDKFYVLYNSEDENCEYGLCMYENINIEIYLKNIIINPYNYDKYSYLFKSFINLIAFNNPNIVLKIEQLPYHQQLEYIVNYGDEEL